MLLPILHDPLLSHKQALVERASREGNSQALRELKEVGPPPYKDGKNFAIQHKWANLFEGADVFLASALGFALYAPGYTIADISDWFDGQGLSGERLAPHFDELDRKLLGGELAIPVLVIQGAQDYTTPVSLARSYLDALHAPRKAFTKIECAGHFARFHKAGRVLEGTQDAGAPVDTLERFSQIAAHVTLPIDAPNSGSHKDPRSRSSILEIRSSQN